jgi:hypothetical protein
MSPAELGLPALTKREAFMAAGGGAAGLYAIRAPAPARWAAWAALAYGALELFRYYQLGQLTVAPETMNAYFRTGGTVSAAGAQAGAQAAVRAIKRSKLVGAARGGRGSF